MSGTCPLLLVGYLWGELIGCDPYTDGTNSVKVSGINADKITLKFGDDASELYNELVSGGAFEDAVSEKIFEDKNKGMLA